jgi:Predicted membrane protein (DUF2157)
MTTLQQLERWRSTGAITADQHAAISAIVRKERFSVFLELNALLYLGVVIFASGLGWTVYAHFTSLGDSTVVVSLAALFTACFAYCFARAASYTPDRIESPTFAFDYVLYLGCLAFAVELGFIEFRFHVLREQWDYYLLGSAVLYLALSYRFDNRFVLSMALSALGGWFGLRFSTLGVHFAGSARGDALIYSALVAATGWWTRRGGLKAHFLETYLHVAVNAALAALVSGVIAGDRKEIWLVGLSIAAGCAIERGIRHRRFAFVSYGAVYGYVGLSAEILPHLPGPYSAFMYFILSGAAAIVSLAIVARRVGREP